MLIDAATRASLELVRPKNDGAPTVFSAIDRTVTAAGARELMNRLVSPSADVELINRRLDAVSALIDDWGTPRAHPQGAQGRARHEPRAVAAEAETRRPARSGRASDGLLAAEGLSGMLAEAAALPTELKEIAQALASLRGPGRSKTPSLCLSPEGERGR